MITSAPAIRKAVIWLTVFSIAMAFLESAVVVYLRFLYYPGGFYFPTPPVDLVVGITELGRELATLVMLTAIGVLIGKTRIQSFGYFLYAFALWDIFYYVFLRLLIHWPASLMNWDILFLIPVIWASPVIYPVISSITMIVLSLLIIVGAEQNETNLLDKWDWVLLITGSCFVLFSFTFGYLDYIFSGEVLNKPLIIVEEGRKMIGMAGYIPGKFSWYYFLIGEIIIIGSIVRVAISFKNKS